MGEVGEIIATHVRSSIETPFEEISTMSLSRTAYNLASAIPLGVEVYGRKKKYFSESMYSTSSLPFYYFTLDPLWAIIFSDLSGTDLIIAFSSSTVTILTAQTEPVERQNS